MTRLGEGQRQRLVVGIDEGPANGRAVDWIADHIRAHHCDLELITAIGELGSDPAAAEAHLTAVQRRLAGIGGSTVGLDLRFGDAATVLVEAARHVDLLVIGSRRDHAVRTALDGWLPERIPTQSLGSTIVVPSDWSRRRGDVVHGVDDDVAVPALDTAARSALRERVGLVLVRAWQAPGIDDLGTLSTFGDPARHEEHGTAAPRRCAAGRHPPLPDTLGAHTARRGTGGEGARHAR